MRITLSGEASLDDVSRALRETLVILKAACNWREWSLIQSGSHWNAARMRAEREFEPERTRVSALFAEWKASSEPRAPLVIELPDPTKAQIHAAQ